MANPMPEDFQTFRRLWKATLTGEGHDWNEPEISVIIDRLNLRAEQYLNDIQFDASQIWPDLSPIHLSINFRKCYDRLRTITLAYSVRGTSMYEDAKILHTVLVSLDLLNAEAYNSSMIVNPDENWWNYRIGASKPLVDISMMLYDELRLERRHEYGITISKMVGDLNGRSLIGSNRANMCKILIGASILTQDSKEFNRGRNALFDIDGEGKNSLFRYVNNGEGFYEDGSYLSHHVYPYAGGYGLTHILAVSQIAYVLQNSVSAIPDSEMSIIYQSVEGCFEPFVFRGMVMGNVRGREVSRKSDNDVYAGQLLVQAALQLLWIAPEPYKLKLKFLALSWIKDAPFVGMDDSGIVIASGVQILKKQDNIAPMQYDTGFRIFPMSDRIVFHQKNWSATLALSSARTGRYETLNNENLRPFYQGDGFLQVYLDNDRQHFTEYYYPTMDPYHTPGTTAGQNIQEVATYRSTAYNDWAGGLQWEALGAASLDYLSTDRTVSAKKSWFFLVNAILALGSSCNGTSGAEIHSTIESRKSLPSMPQLLINGEATNSSLFPSWKQTYSRPSWAYLGGVGGYHFLNSDSITFERTTVEGRWTDINKYPDYAKFDELSVQRYTTIYKNHGIDPVDGNYAFAILPNLTTSATEKLVESPEYFVIANTASVQAVTFHRNQTTMATFWEPGEVGDVHAMTPCQLAWGISGLGIENKNYIVALSDPSQRLDKIEIKIRNMNSRKVLWNDPEVIYTRVDMGEVKLQVNTKSSRGKTFGISFINEYAIAPIAPKPLELDLLVDD